MQTLAQISLGSAREWIESVERQRGELRGKTKKLYSESYRVFYASKFKHLMLEHKLLSVCMVCLEGICRTMFLLTFCWILCFNYCFVKPQHGKFPLETNQFYVNSQRSVREGDSNLGIYFVVRRRKHRVVCISLHSQVWQLSVLFINLKCSRCN